MKVNFEDELNKIAAIDDSVEPEILQSANKVIVKNTESSQIFNTKKDKKGNSILTKTLLQIHKEKEAKK